MGLFSSFISPLCLCTFPNWLRMKKQRVYYKRCEHCGLKESCMSTILAHKKNILVLFLISTILQQKWRYSQFENLQWNLSVYKTRIAYFIQCAQVSLIDKFFHEIIQGLSTNNAPKNRLLQSNEHISWLKSWLSVSSAPFEGSLCTKLKNRQTLGHIDRLEKEARSVVKAMRHI